MRLSRETLVNLGEPSFADAKGKMHKCGAGSRAMVTNVVEQE